MLKKSIEIDSALTPEAGYTVKYNGTDWFASAPVSIIEKTSDYVLSASDAGATIEMNVGIANTLTVPPDSSVNFPIGTEISVSQTGTGDTTLVAGFGVTINSINNLSLEGQWSTVRLIKRSSNNWLLLKSTNLSTSINAGDFVMGGYIELDGVDERVNLGNVPAMEVATGSTWSVSLWVRSDGSNNVWFGVSSATDADNAVYLYENAANQLAITFRLGGDTYARTKNSAITEGQWAHVMMTSEGTDFRVWINGAEITSWSTVTNTYPAATETWDGTAEVWIGCGAGALGFHTAGKIAQVAMWSTDQSANVAAVYAAVGNDLRELGSPPDVFYMPMSTYNQSETATDGFRDLSGNGYHGTGENMDGDELIGSSVTSIPAYSWLDGGLTWKP